MRFTYEQEKLIRDLIDVGMCPEHIPTSVVEFLLAEIDALRVSAKNCKHPRCCCVCGHEGKCPEDGPTLI